MSNQGTVPKSHWWQRKKGIMVFAMGTFAVITLIFAAYAYHWDWIGLSSSRTATITTEITQSPPKKVTTTETVLPGKTLWDWLQLLGVLAIPVVVGFGTAFFTRQQTKISEANRTQQHDTEIQIAENQQQEELLRTYFDRISELLLNKEPSTNPNIQSIVRARTLAALHILNTERRAIVLRFLHDANLLRNVKQLLSGLDLSNTDLNGIDLSEAFLYRADLSGTDLSEANLSFTNLEAVRKGFRGRTPLMSYFGLSGSFSNTRRSFPFSVIYE